MLCMTVSNLSGVKSLESNFAQSGISLQMFKCFPLSFAPRAALRNRYGHYILPLCYIYLLQVFVIFLTASNLRDPLA